MHHPASTTNKSAFIYNILAGLVLTVFSIILVKLFSHGDGLGYVLPVIYGTAIVIGSIIGKVFMKEDMTLMQTAGIFITAIGISLVAVAKR